jgi:hypothetical protein
VCSAALHLSLLYARTELLPIELGCSCEWIRHLRLLLKSRMKGWMLFSYWYLIQYLDALLLGFQIAFLRGIVNFPGIKE